MKVQAHSSLEPPLEYNQDQMPLMNQGLYYDLSNHILSYGNTIVGNTISNSPKVLTVKFLGSDGLFCFSSICKFGSFKNPFAMSTSLPELYFRFRKFILLTKKKKKISMNYIAVQAAENHEDE